MPSANAHMATNRPARPVSQNLTISFSPRRSLVHSDSVVFVTRVHSYAYLDEVVREEPPLPLARPLPPSAVHLLHVGDQVAGADRQLVRELRVVVELHADVH